MDLDADDASRVRYSLVYSSEKYCASAAVDIVGDRFVSCSSSGGSSVTHVSIRADVDVSADASSISQVKFRATVVATNLSAALVIDKLTRQVKGLHDDVRIQAYSRPLTSGVLDRVYIAPIHMHIRIPIQPFVSLQFLHLLASSWIWISLVICVVAGTMVVLVSFRDFPVVPVAVTYALTALALAMLISVVSQFSRQVVRVIMLQFDTWMLLSWVAVLAWCDSIEAINTSQYHVPVLRAGFCVVALFTIIGLDASGCFGRHFKAALYGGMVVFFAYVAFRWHENIRNGKGMAGYDAWLLPNGALLVHVGTAAQSAAVTLACFMARFAIRYVLGCDCALFDIPFEVISVAHDREAEDELVGGNDEMRQRARQVERALCSDVATENSDIVLVKIAGSVPVEMSSASPPSLTSALPVADHVLRALDSDIFTHQVGAVAVKYSIAKVHRTLHDRRGKRTFVAQTPPVGFSPRGLVPIAVLSRLVHSVEWVIAFGAASLICFTVIASMNVARDFNPIGSIIPRLVATLLMLVQISQLSREMVVATLKTFEAWYCFVQFVASTFCSSYLFYAPHSGAVAISHALMMVAFSVLVVLIDCVTPPQNVQSKSNVEQRRRGGQRRRPVSDGVDGDDPDAESATSQQLQPSQSSLGSVAADRNAEQTLFESRIAETSGITSSRLALQHTLTRRADAALVGIFTRYWRLLKGVAFVVCAVYNLVLVFLWQEAFNSRRHESGGDGSDPASQQINFLVVHGSIATLGQLSAFMLALMQIRFAYRYLVLRCNCIFMYGGIVEEVDEEIAKVAAPALPAAAASNEADPLISPQQLQ